MAVEKPGKLSIFSPTLWPPCTTTTTTTTTMTIATATTTGDNVVRAHSCCGEVICLFVCQCWQDVTDESVCEQEVY